MTTIPQQVLFQVLRTESGVRQKYLIYICSDLCEYIYATVYI